MSAKASSCEPRRPFVASGRFVVVLALALTSSAWAQVLGSASRFTNEPIKPLPAEPALDVRKVALGRQLFEDRRLSGNNVMACSACHDVRTNGATGRIKDIGPFGLTMTRNTPTVFNSSLSFRQFWDGHVATQGTAIAEVVESQNVMRSTWPTLLVKLRADADTVGRFKDIYSDGVQQANLVDAMATYLASLRTPNARIDRYLAGDVSALTAKERQGYALFKAYGCVACHQGVNIGGNMFQVMGVVGNRGEYFVRHGGRSTDNGRFAITGQEADKFVFRVPSLRNVAVTAPYLHDGSAATLRDAVQAMFEYQLGRNPSAQDLDLIVEFLGTLTGEYQGHALKTPGAR